MSECRDHSANEAPYGCECFKELFRRSAEIMEEQRTRLTAATAALEGLGAKVVDRVWMQPCAVCSGGMKPWSVPCNGKCKDGWLLIPPAASPAKEEK